jgi:acetyl esterase/lipase
MLLLFLITQNINKYGGDQNNIVVMGHSAGAHIGALLATDQSYFTQYPDTYGAIKAFVGLSGPYAFEPEAQKFKDIFGPPERYPLMRAPNYVDGSEPPMLLLHGADDSTVTPENTQRLEVALEDKNVQVQTILYDDVSHMGMIATYIWFWKGNDKIKLDIDKFLTSLNADEARLE